MIEDISQKRETSTAKDTLAATEDTIKKAEDSKDTLAATEDTIKKAEDSKDTLAATEDTIKKAEDSTDTLAATEDTIKPPEDSTATFTKSEETSKQPLLFKIFKKFSIIVWSVVILIVIIPLLGRVIINNALLDQVSIDRPANTQVFPDRDKIALQESLDLAYQTTKEYSDQKLNEWEEQLIKKLDQDFLPWYFNYFNQKGQELSVLFQFIGENVINGFQFDQTNQKIAKSINDNIQREFAKKVLSAESSEMKFKTILIDTTQFYIKEISNNVSHVSKLYKIPKTDWNEYIKSLKITLDNDRGDDVSLVKLLGAYGGSKIAAKFAAKAGSTAIATISTKVAGIIDPAVALALIAYDYWDYKNGVAENQPRLREDLVSELDNIKYNLLNDPQQGVMSVVNELEEKIKNSVF